MISVNLSSEGVCFTNISEFMVKYSQISEFTLVSKGLSETHENSLNTPSLGCENFVEKRWI